MTLQTGITFSCDVVFYEIGKGFWYADEDKKLGMQDTFEKWGLGSATGIDLPSEASGTRAYAPIGSGTISRITPMKTAHGRAVTIPILQLDRGDILVTPMQMCCVYAGIAK